MNNFTSRLPKAWLFASLSLLSFAVSSISPFISTAHAASPMDGVLAPTSSIVVSDTSAGHGCTGSDITTTVAGYIGDATKWTNAVGVSQSEVASAWSATLASGSGWAIGKQTYTGSTSTGVGNFHLGNGDSWAVLTFGQTGGFVDFASQGGSYAAIQKGTSGASYEVVVGMYHDPSTGGCSAQVAVARKAGDATDNATVLTSIDSIGVDSANTWYGSMTFTQLFVNETINYPSGYAGVTPPTSLVPVVDQTPQFSWTVSKSGSVNFTYLKNISPFLSGFETVATNSMGTNWTPLGSEVDHHTEAPLGWLNYDYQLPAVGYYMTRLSYDETFESDLWSTPYPNIKTVWIQYYWDGVHATSGSTVGGCPGDICNTQRPAPGTNSDVFNTFGGLGTPTYGLQAVAIAPLTFLSGLASQVGHCTPITMPAVRSFTFTFECVGTRIQDNFPGLVAVYQTVLTALVFYWMGMRFLRLFRDAQDPNHNQITVLDL